MSMDQTAEIPPEPSGTSTKPKPSYKAGRRKMQRTRSFVDALREKYCSPENESQSDFIVHIVFRGRPKNNGPTSAELAHLRNIVLSNRRVSTGGLPELGLQSLCPNVTDLDLSSNLFESWAELLPLMSQLQHLKFINLSRNHITRHKEELWRWSTPLPRVENLVLNSTGVPLREVLALARLMPALRELHICCNYYRDLGSVELAINDGALSKLECLRLNENIITSWAEVWKLRKLPCLTQLILSENPLCDVMYDAAGDTLDCSLCDMDSPNITCHSDGEDSAVGSPSFRYPVKRMQAPMSCKKVLFPENSEENLTETQTQTECNKNNNSSGEADSRPTKQAGLVNDLLDDIISHACERVSIQESNDHSESRKHDGQSEPCEHEKSCEHSKQKDVGEGYVESAQSKPLYAESCENDNETKMRVSGLKCGIGNDNENGNKMNQQPKFYLDDEESFDVAVDKNENFPAQEENEECSCADNTAKTDSEKFNEDAENQNTPQKQDKDCEGSTLPFANLHTLCLSRTSICDLDHLHALTQFPQLRSLKIMDIALFSDLHQEDRRKLFVASLPNVKILNGSEVASIEREKAERHYLRHFLDASEKTQRYEDLERRHGPVQPLFDIDLGARFQKEVTLTFMMNGVKMFSEAVSMLQTVEKLRCFVAKRLGVPKHSFRMLHFACGPYQSPADRSVDELFLDSLPLSRFDFMDGDELHVDLVTESQAPVLSHQFHTSDRSASS